MSDLTPALNVRPDPGSLGSRMSDLTPALTPALPSLLDQAQPRTSRTGIPVQAIATKASSALAAPT